MIEYFITCEKCGRLSTGKPIEFGGRVPEEIHGWQNKWTKDLCLGCHQAVRAMEKKNASVIKQFLNIKDR